MLNNVIVQTYQKSFIGTGNEPTRAGYQFMGLQNSPNRDIPGACWITLEACFQLCDSKGNVSIQGWGSSNSYFNNSRTSHFHFTALCTQACGGFTMHFDHNNDGNGNCCWLKYYVSATTLVPFLGSDFGVTYLRTGKAPSLNEHQSLISPTPLPGFCSCCTRLGRRRSGCWILHIWQEPGFSWR